MSASSVHPAQFLGCIQLCDARDYSSPVFSVLRIFWARTLEWVDIPLSKRVG